MITVFCELKTKSNTITIDRYYIIDCEEETRTKSDFIYPSYGIVVPNGTLTVNDYSGMIYNELNKTEDYSDLIIKILLKNTLTKNTYPISTLSVKDFNYNSFNKTITFSLYHKVEHWQDKLNDNIYFGVSDYDIGGSTKGDNIWKKLKSNATDITFSDINHNSQILLEQYDTRFASLDSNNTWANFTSFCELMCGNIYPNRNGNLEFTNEIIED